MGGSFRRKKVGGERAHAWETREKKRFEYFRKVGHLRIALIKRSSLLVEKKTSESVKSAAKHKNIGTTFKRGGEQTRKSEGERRGGSEVG